jgi:enterobacteria phage integrase
MSPARRSIKRRDWPRGLREPRPGYYTWDHPDGRCLVIGRVPLAVARNEALAANQHVLASRPGLLERLTGTSNTVAQLLDTMPVPGNPNTAKSWRSLDKIIRLELGAKQCSALETRDCAQLIAKLVDKARTAEAVRSRLIAVCQRGQEEGWMDHNPAQATRRPAVVVQRGRLTLEMYAAIRARADEVNEWLGQAMDLAAVTGADRMTVAGLERSAISADVLAIARSKTGVMLEIPLRIRLEALGLELSALVKRRTGVVSRYLVHHVSPWGNAPAGSSVHPDRVSHAFTEARKLAEVPDVLPDGKLAPTFHEIRSLSKRLYDAQGNVDTKALLGHKTERMATMYADPRGAEAVRVRVG